MLLSTIFQSHYNSQYCYRMFLGRLRLGRLRLSGLPAPLVLLNKLITLTSVFLPIHLHDFSLYIVDSEMHGKQCRS